MENAIDVTIKHLICKQNPHPTIKNTKKMTTTQPICKKNEKKIKKCKP
jgi:DNA transposition AAA+ family ATPase